MAFGLTRKTGVKLYQAPSDRKDTNKIYLFKSLSGLKRKDKIYAIGYNLTSLGAILPGFNAGIVGAVPYFLGEISNNAASIQKALKGDLGALRGRGQFLTSANVVNRTASRLVSAISSPTGIGAVDRAANIYIGQQKARFLHYTRNMGKKDQLKVLVEAIGDGKVLDKEIQRQAQMSQKGNVFAKWKTLTYYKAVKSAPDPWRDNPYIQAREAQRNKNIKQKKFRSTAGLSPRTDNTELHMAQLISQTDDMINARDAMQNAAKVVAIDEILTMNNFREKRSSKLEGLMSQLKADEKFRNQRFTKIKSDKLDNLTYRSLLESTDIPSDKFTMGGRGASDVRLARTKGLEMDPNTNQFVTNVSKEAHDKAYINFLSTNNTFKQFKGDTAADILDLAKNVPATPNVIQAFNNYATKMGRVNMNLSDNTSLAQVTQNIFSIMFSGLMTGGGTSSKSLAADIARDFGALEELAGEIAREGFVDVADDILEVMDPNKVLRASESRILAPETKMPNSHFMESRKDLIQVKSDYNQNFEYGSTFRQSDYLLNKRPGTEIRLKQLNVTDGDIEGLDDYLYARQEHNRIKKKYPGMKKTFTEKAIGGTKKQRLEVAKAVMRDNLDKPAFFSMFNFQEKTPKGNIEFLDNFIDSIGEAENPRLINLLKRDDGVRRLNDKMVKDIVNFVEDGVPTENILNHIEKQFKIQNKLLGQAIKKGQPIVSDFEDYVPDQITRKGGSTVDVRRGQSTFVSTHDNYVPSQTHIIDAIHMHDIELNGKDEDDGSGYLFREQVSFGGHDQHSKSATRIRDAVAIEFGGPATDKTGKLRNRGDRMFYLPSFFIGSSASEAAAFLGIFDKGSTFKASSKQAGLNNKVFRMADEGTGVFNATRKQFNENKRKHFEGQRRVTQMFADARKAVNNHRKANFSNEGVRLANQRAMSLFKRGGGFGQINIDDVTKQLSPAEMRKFGITGTGFGQTAKGKDLQFNLNKLGGYRPTNASVQLKPPGGTSKSYNDGTSQFTFIAGQFSAQTVMNKTMRNKDGAISMETGYAPLVPQVFDTKGNILQSGTIGKRSPMTDAHLRGIEKGKASFKGAQNAEAAAARTQLALAEHSKDDVFFNMVENPYDTMQKVFHLGTRDNGTGSIWHTENFGRDTQSPNHPFARFTEMFFGSSHKFESELIRSFTRQADVEAGDVLNYLMAAGMTQEYDDLIRAIRVQAAFVAKAYMRQTGTALQAAGNQILTEDAFRSLTMTFAVLLEANKEHFKFEMKKKLRSVTQGIKMDAKMEQAIKNNMDMRPMIQTSDAEFDEIERLLGQGIAFGYDEQGTAGFVTFSGQIGFRKEFEDSDNLSMMATLLPDFSGGNRTGRIIGKIYNFDNREQALKAALGVSDFQEVRWDRSMRLGLQDLSTDSRFLRGERWSIAQELAQEFNMPASHFMNDNSNMVEAIMKDATVADQVGNQIAAWTKRAQAEQLGEIADREVAREIMALDAFLQAKGMTRRNRLNEIKMQFGKIVAESKASPAKHNDPSFHEYTITIANQQKAINQSLAEIRKLKSAASVKAGGKVGRTIADKVYDLFVAGHIEDRQIAHLLASGVVNAKSRKEGADLLKNFYQSMQFLSPHQGVSRVSLNYYQLNDRLTNIFIMRMPQAYQKKITMDISQWTDTQWLALAEIIRKNDAFIDPFAISVISHGKKPREQSAPIHTGKASIHKDKNGRPYISVRKAGGIVHREYLTKKDYNQLKGYKKRFDK